MVGKSRVNIRLPVFSHLLWGNSLPKHRSEPMGLLWSIGWVSMASLLPSGNGGSGRHRIEPWLPSGNLFPAQGAGNVPGKNK